MTSTADSGAGSLRQALLDSAGSSGSNTIVFQISGTAPFTISPQSVLPSVSNPTLIDGTTQSGFAGKPVIELNGNAAGSGVAGLQLSSGFSIVRGLVINRFSGQGIVLGGPSNVVQGCYIGTDVAGKIARANGSYGIWAKSQGNFIGGTNTGNGNVIAGGNDTGIYVYITSGNTIQGNLIGITAAGTNALGNANNGIMLDKSGGNLIGGASAGMRNIIAGNGQTGIYLNDTAAGGNVIQGNYIGADISGTNAVGNATNGITINGAPNNLIGGFTPGSGNVISANGSQAAGISINNAGAFSNTICGNLIGTDATGRTNLGSQLQGVVVFAANFNQLGGTNVGAGNVVSGNTQDGIFLTGGAAWNLIQGNLIGLSAAGTNAVRNGFNGISISGGNSNTVGGSVSAGRNVISGNTYNGVGILSLGDNANAVFGNYIGTDITGLKAVPNTLAGVRIQGCSNFIGGAISGAGNVISGNSQQGIWLVGANGNVTGNCVQGNLIGLDATGANGLPNGNAGVGITTASANLVGGTATGARNVISANGGNGIFILGPPASGNAVQGNYIGTDSSGMAAQGNILKGIYLEQAATNQIGGSVNGAGNLISANYGQGVFLTNASWNVIQGNFIGTKADGTNNLGNAQANIEMQLNATNNIIGGSAPGAGNRIAFAQAPNGPYAGVRVRTGAFKNLISGNAIFNNAALGIDLSPSSGGTSSGVNPPVDCESGVAANAANAGQNFPVLTNVYTGAGTQIRGTLDSAAGKNYLLEFFASPAGDASGYGEGQVFLGQASLTLGTLCSSNFSISLPVPVPTNWVVTATATSPANNTSEFSAWIPVVAVPQPQIAFASPVPGQAAISWITNAGNNFILQQTISLSPSLWTTVIGTPFVTNGFYLLAVTTTNTSCFYRLSFP